MKLNLRSALLFALIIGCALSCKKKDNINLNSLRLSGVDVTHGSAIQHYRIVYDASNNVDSMVITGGGSNTGQVGYKKFSYLGFSYTITDQNNVIYTVNTNSDNLISKVSKLDTLTMTYSGIQLGRLDVKSPSAAYPYFTVNETNYTWAGGDVTGSSANGVSSAYTYDQGKAAQAGDAFRIDDFLAYGRSIIKTSHTVTEKDIQGTWAEKYLYQYDGQGRISVLKKVINGGGGSTPDTTSYSYKY
jgi:hypothetical protein